MQQCEEKTYLQNYGKKNMHELQYLRNSVSSSSGKFPNDGP